MAALRTRYLSAKRRAPRWVLHVVFVFVATAILVGALLRLGSLPPLGELRHPDLGWLLIAVLAQAASLAAYALVVREFLSVGGVGARVSALMRATVGGIAMGASVPGGQVASAAYWYRQLRHEGAERGLSAFAMLASMLAGVLSLAALLVAGVAAAGGGGPFAAIRIPILAAVGSLLVFAVLFGGRATRGVVRLVRRLAPGLGDGYSPDRRRLGVIGIFAFANWLLDCACLYAALTAVHASVPWQSILITYGLAQLVAALPLLPGGGGTVEASLLLGFAAFPHSSGSVLAGVLLYRLLCCWGLIPIGWLAVLSENRHLPWPRLRTVTVLEARPAC